MSEGDDNDENTRIRELNDAFRRSGQGGRIMATAGIRGLPVVDQAEIFEKVRLFAAFSEANDPYGEHDFGAIEHRGQQIFFKIDYYDRQLKYHSENAADPDRTVRVMTIMLACEH